MIFGSWENRIVANVGGILVTLVLLVAPLSGEEPVTKFVEALRDSHYHDTALDYLDSLLDGSPSQRDYVMREKQLVEAGRAFVDFAAGHPRHPLVMSARLYARRVTISRREPCGWRASVGAGCRPLGTTRSCDTESPGWRRWIG